MSNISFIQFLFLIFLLFLLFGDFKKLHVNSQSLRNFFYSKPSKKQDFNEKK